MGQSKEMSETPGYVNVHGGYTLEQALASVGPGWADLVRAAFQACEDADVEISQVKEKWGGLTIYTNGAPRHVSDTLWAIMEKSAKICEECGERGKRRNSGWIRTLCDKHAESGSSRPISQ